MENKNATHFNPEALDALDLEPIKFKLVTQYGWSLEKADAVESLYKGYLRLCATHVGKTIVPTIDIDEMWHAHILDTRKYQEDCEKVFGGFMHHYPYLGMLGDEDDAQEGFLVTKSLFLSELGIDLTHQIVGA